MEEVSRWTDMFGRGLRGTFERIPLEYGRLQEVRLRVGRPVYLRLEDLEYAAGEDGRLLESGRHPGRGRLPGCGQFPGCGQLLESGRLPGCRQAGQAGENGGDFSPRIVTEKDLRETVECMGNYSLYAYEEELRQGFLTVRGGHRVGVAGKVILEHGAVKSIRSISSLNVRFAHQVRGCGEKILPWVTQEGRFLSSLLISPPGGGKTTLLRDLIRLLSDGFETEKGGFVPGVNVGVVDERSEIAACLKGVPQNDLGSRADVLDGCPKALGMMMLVRSMAPAVLAADEIGGEEDLRAVEYAATCGCRLLATIHGRSVGEIRRKPLFERILGERIFERFVILGGERAGQVREIADGTGRILWRMDSAAEEE